MRISVLKPAEAPPGVQRLLALLQASLGQAEFETCRIVAAFARLSGVARLLPQIRTWRSGRRSIEAILGIDRLGTSREALEVLLDELDAVYVTSTTDPSCTFHPKMYLFEGPRRARAFVGSHNLTVGGLETNFEGGVVVDLELPREAAQWQAFREAWDQLLPGANPCTRWLDGALLEELAGAGWLLPERQLARTAAPSNPTEPGLLPDAAAVFPAIAPAPPSPLPRSLVPGRGAGAARRNPARPAVIEQPGTLAALPRALVIEILPHHNGEILLSKQATDAFPAFFGMPFSGRGDPKKAGNPSYPVRIPRPTLEWRFYAEDARAPHISRGDLYMIHYERKSEIRITVTPPALARSFPEYSLMVLWGGSSQLPEGLDYIAEVFVPGSPGQRRWESALNIVLPSGGKPRPRRMGWI